MKKIALIIILVVVFIVLVVGNAVNYKSAERYKRLLAVSEEQAASGSQADTPDGGALPEVDSPAPDSSPVPAAAALPEAGSHEEGITEVSELFILAYYDMDTERAPEEYITGFDGLLTPYGLQNIGGRLSRPSGSEANLRLTRNMAACNVYVHTKGPKDATAFCTVYVRQVLMVRDDEPVVSFDPILVRLELKLEDDAQWRINGVSFERSLSTLNFDVEELFG